jgi:hypothetical protein
MTTYTLNRLGRATSVGGALLVAISLFVLPSRSFQSLLGAAGAGLSPFQTAALIASLGITVVGFLLYRVSQPAIAAGSTPQTIPTSRVILVLNLMLAALVVGRAISQINGPLDIDENIHALSIAQHRIAQELNPINTDPRIYSQNHVAAQLLSIVSVKLFGLNKLAVRAPSILLTGLLLAALFTLCRGVGGSLITTIVLSHFLLNQLVIWYFHSARGYVAMMVLTIVPFLIVWDFTLKRRPGEPWRMALFAFCFLCAVFTHLFGAIFNGLLFLSLLTWMAAHREELDETARHYGAKLLTTALFIFPVYGFVIAHNLLFLSRIGDLNAGSPPNIAESLLGAFGLSLSWQGKLLTILLVGLGLHSIFNDRKWLKSLPAIFTLVTFAFFFTAITALRTRVFEPRFVLAFLPPLLFWIGEAVLRIRGRGARTAILVIFGGALIVSPFLSTAALYRRISYDMSDYDHFLKTVRERAQPVAENCVTFYGQDDVVIWARDLYFGDALNAKSPTAPCPKHFYAYLPSTEAKSGQAIRANVPKTAVEIFRNARGMTLSEVR